MTVVVAPAGLDAPFPEKNRALFRQVLDAGGAYLSLVADDVPATQNIFFRRNACLVALSHALIVTQAPVRSGARNAAKWARRLGRPLLAVPCSPWQRRGGGSVVELRLGARICTGPRDVMRELERQHLTPLPLASPPDPPQAQLPFSPRHEPTPVASGDSAAVIAAIAAGARTLDEICDRSALSPATVQRHVLTLTLEGVLAPDPGSGRLGVRTASLVSVTKISKSKA